jgi:DNA-binding IclR family transcriptional regulator
VRKRAAARPGLPRGTADLAASTRPMVAPVARALTLLSAYTPQEPWLGNRELALRTGMPPSTVSRLAQSLAALGYLHHDAERRKYRLAASVLALGYAAIAHSDMQRLARQQMQAFAEQHKVHVTLSTRDRLDLVVLERSSSPAAQISLNLHVGTRMGIASSPMGWALLAALPDLERYYLLGNVERRMPREWPRLRRRSSEAISQVHNLGFCTSLGEWDRDLGIVAVPLMVPGHAPLALACVGSSAQMTKARVERELGPRLLGMATALQERAGAVE